MRPYRREDPTIAFAIEQAGLSNFRFLPEPAISEVIQPAGDRSIAALSV